MVASAATLVCASAMISMCDYYMMFEGEGMMIG